MVSGNSPFRALTSLRGLPVKSQPGEDEHSNGPVRREHHQVEVDSDHGDYWREPRPESMNRKQCLTLALPLGLCLPQGHKHSQPGSHDPLTSSPQHIAYVPRAPASALALGTCFESRRQGVPPPHPPPPLCSMQSALSPQCLHQQHSGLQSMAGSQWWLTLIWPPEFRNPGETEPGTVFLQISISSLRR